ncbi:MAG TPA: YqiA/YcfP family alpha/beta fold hydrolase, partial [Burkholderiaceae bacterium]
YYATWVAERIGCRAVLLNPAIRPYDDLQAYLGLRTEYVSGRTVEVTLSGLRRRDGPARILAVLEPRSNTMKLGSMQDRLPGCLQQADLVLCFAPRSGRHALGWNAAEALAPLGARARVFESIDGLVEAVAATARSGDHVLVMSNGSFGGVHARVLDALAAAAPAAHARQPA